MIKTLKLLPFKYIDSHIRHDTNSGCDHACASDIILHIERYPKIKRVYTTLDDNTNDPIFVCLEIGSNRSWAYKLPYHLDSELFNFIKNNENVVLVCSSVHEGDSLFYEMHEINKLYVERIHEGLSHVGIDANRVIYLSNNTMIEREIAWWKYQHPTEKTISCKSFLFEFDFQRILIYYSFFKEYTHEDYLNYRIINIDKLKHFNRISRSSQFERSAFVLYSKLHGFFDKVDLSFTKHDPEQYDIVYSHLTYDQIPDEVNFLEPFNEYKHLITESLPTYINKRDEVNNTEVNDNEEKFTAECYMNNFIGLVFNPFPAEPGCHITSLYYHMFLRQPFMIFGEPHTLRELKRLGFETFSEWIDESYDDEENYTFRMKKYFEEVHRISKLSIDEMLQMYDEMNWVLDHNFEVLKRSQPNIECVEYIRDFCDKT